MRRTLTCLLVLCLMLCGVLTGCGDDGTGRGFRFPLAAEPTQLDPQMATDTSSVTLLAALFEGLTRLDTTGKAMPGAADWTVSEDGLTYTFTLRESYWSTLSLRNQETDWDEPVRVVADDFVYGLQRALSPETGAIPDNRLYNIVNAKAVQQGKASVAELGVKALDDTRLTITLTKPDETFPAVLATTVCMPCNRAFFAYTGGRYGLEEEYLITNGAFFLEEWTHDQSLLLYKNETYHAADTVSPVAVRYVIAPKDPATSVQTGALDVAELTAAQAATAEAAGVGIVELEDSVRSLWFNTRRAVLAEPAIRQALRDSIQWETVYTHLAEADETPAVGYVPPAATVTGGGNYRRPENEMAFTTQVEAARTALGKGLARLYPETTAPLLPALTVLAAEDEVSANLARYIIQSWQKNLKVYATLTTLPEGELAAAVQSGNYDIAIYTHTPTGLTGGEILSGYATGAAGNLAQFSNESIDAAIKKALTGDRAACEELETLLWQQCPSLPLSYPKRYYGITPGSEGITVRPFGGGVYGSPLEFRQAKKWD